MPILLRDLTSDIILLFNENKDKEIKLFPKRKKQRSFKRSNSDHCGQQDSRGGQNIIPWAGALFLLVLSPELGPQEHRDLSHARPEKHCCPLPWLESISLAKSLNTGWALPHTTKSPWLQPVAPGELVFQFFLL